jgi:hypothetical protein
MQSSRGLRLNNRCLISGKEFYIAKISRLVLKEHIASIFRIEEIISAYLMVLSEIISSTLKMKAICSSGTSVATQQTTRRHIPKDDILQTYLYYTKNGTN